MNEKIIVSADYEKALNIDKQIKVNAQMAQSCLYEVCKGLKEMRDGKLYKQLGYQNFEDYSENEVGIKRRQAYNYISIIENIGAENVQPVAHLGSTKLFLLAKLDEEKRSEFLENNDVEEMSKRELEKKIKEIKTLQYKLDTLNRENITIAKQRKELTEKLDKVNEENEILSERIEELENKPVDVAVADNSHEIDNMRKAMAKCDLDWRTAYDKLQEESFAEARNHQQEIAQIKAEYEQKLSEIPKAETDNKEIFKAYLANAVDSSKRLVEFIKSQSDNGFYIEKSAEFFNKMMEELK